MLSLDQQGQVIAVNDSAPTTMFGFKPSDLLGTPLSTFINVFEEGKKKGMNEVGLLTLLAAHEQVCNCLTFEVSMQQCGAM